MERIQFRNWTPHRLGDMAAIAENTITDDLNTPVFSRSEDIYCFQGKKYYNVGIWEGWLDHVDEEHQYQFRLNHRESGKAARIFAAVLGTDEAEQGLTMAYMQEENDNTLVYCYRPIQGVKKIKLQVIFRCFEDGEAMFTEPEVQVLPASTVSEAVDTICVGTTCFGVKEYTYIGECLPEVEAIIDRAAKDPNKPDILLFTETTLDRYVSLSLYKKGILEDCEGMRRIQQKAKEHKMHIIIGLHEQTEEAMYNTAYVIDDNGDIIGKQRKVQITYSEVVNGMAPGEELKAINTKFGKIGILICWDAWYPEVARELYKQGARILFHLTAGRPVPIQRARAQENGIPFVASFTSLPEYSCIYDGHGDEVAHVESVEKGYVTAKVLLGKPFYIPRLGVMASDSVNGAYAHDVHKVEIRKDLY